MASEAAVVETLALLAAPPHGMDMDHDETLHIAAEHNDVDGLRRAMAVPGADLDALDSQLQYTPAIHASGTDSVGALVLLKAHGADLAKPGRRGITCLWRAAASGSVRTLGLLIKSGMDVDVEYDPCGDGDGDTVLEWLGLPPETGSLHGSRLHGKHLVSAQLLILAGAYVESGVIVHRVSREILHTWARSELATEAGFHTFMMGLARGRSDVDTPCELSKAYVDGVPQHIASYLARRTPQELRRLARAAWVWDDEVQDEAYRAQTRAFPRGGYCIDMF